ncbi:hypothetical protein B0H17DRAFT_1193149 [Mycena rosella]|uniref:N-acetyltransferase domain-containing protein n=1 Tax=Mycena rosella TaxID=1033263 RepID=A0AAD7GUA8_MYCRO|nr:hypothetical protein B0H17DRAFT_1193149 [Mycena rosella]
MEDATASHFLLADSAKIDAGGNGNGAGFINALEAWALQQEGFYVVELEAQVGTVGFYERWGYTSQRSEPYLRERTPHLLTKKDLRV